MHFLGQCHLPPWSVPSRPHGATAFAEPERKSPLARRPYDLRHAAVSTWLAAGVPPTIVAQWAGHGVDVLLKVYAHAVDGQAEIAMKRIEEALNDEDGEAEAA